MSTADHPHGGGRGKSKGNRHPVSPWGIPVSLIQSFPHFNIDVDSRFRPSLVIRHVGSLYYCPIVSFYQKNEMLWPLHRCTCLYLLISLTDVVEQGLSINPTNGSSPHVSVIKAREGNVSRDVNLEVALPSLVPLKAVWGCCYTAWLPNI
jgi:hypothetical protein